MTKEISSRDDIIDSRGVIARIEELESDLASAHEGDTAESDISFEDWLAIVAGDENRSDCEEANELLKLRAFAEEGEGFSDWHHGETLIRESYFKTYAQEFAEDIGAIDNNADWPNNCIDWEQAARELQMDYSSIEFDGVTYYARS